MIDLPTVEALAQQLDQARHDRAQQQPLARSIPGLSAADGYRILRAGIDLRRQNGEKIVGFKMGLTSRAKREQIKIDSPIWGILTDGMRLPDGGDLPVQAGIHPRAEPEIAFVMKSRLSGTVSREQALGAIASVCTALEILDSRYIGFKDFSLPDVIADNGSAWRFVLSDESAPPHDLMLDRLQMKLTVDDRVVHEAQSSEISGHPADSIVQLCALIEPYGLELSPGDVVLAGAATPAISLEPGRTIRVHAGGLPSASFLTT